MNLDYISVSEADGKLLLKKKQKKPNPKNKPKS